MSGRFDRIYRILKAISLIESDYRKLKASDIANIFGISERTFHRDREVMEDLGVPIYYNKEKETYVIKDSFKFSPPALEQEEALALLLVTTVFTDEKFPYSHQLNTAISKIYESLPETMKKIVNKRKEFIYIKNDSKLDLSQFKDIIDKLEDAIITTKTVSILYYSLNSDTQNKRKVDPYKIYLNEGIAYLVGFCHLRNEVRIFRIDRIKEIEVMESHFTKVKDFSIEEYMSNTWGVERGKEVEIKVKFTGFAAKYVEEIQWHSSQSIERLDENTIIYSVTTGSLKEIKNWILGFGADAEVLQPDWFRKEIRDEINKLFEIYEKN